MVRCTVAVAVMSAHLAGDEEEPVRLGGRTREEIVSAVASAGTEERDAMVLDLLQYRGASVDVFIALVESERNELRVAGATGLCALGPLAHGAVGSLRKACSSVDDEVRASAISALGCIGPAAKEAVPVIRGCLSDPNASSAAARALSRIDPTIEAGIPVLLENLRTGRPRDQVESLLALQSVRASQGLVAEALSGSLNSSSPNVRRLALRCYVGLGTCAAKYTELIAAALDDDDVRCRTEAARVLTVLGVANEDVTDVLESSAASADEWARVVASATLWKIHGEKYESVTPLTSALKGQSPLFAEAADRLADVGPPAKRLIVTMLEGIDGRRGNEKAAVAKALLRLGGDRDRARKLLEEALATGYFDGCSEAVLLLESLR